MLHALSIAAAVACVTFTASGVRASTCTPCSDSHFFKPACCTAPQTCCGTMTCCAGGEVCVGADQCVALTPAPPLPPVPQPGDIAWALPTGQATTAVSLAYPAGVAGPNPVVIAATTSLSAYDVTTGAVVWTSSYQVLPGLEVILQSTSTAADSDILVLQTGVGDNQLSSVGAANGTVNWQLILDDVLACGVQTSARGDIILVVTQASFTALSARTGATLWKNSSVPSPTACAATVMPDRFFIQTAGFVNMTLLAVDPSTGSVPWQAPAANIGIAVGRSTVFVESNSGGVAAYDAASGAMLYSLSVDSYQVFDDVLFTTSVSGNIDARQCRDGSVIWRWTNSQEAAIMTGFWYPSSSGQRSPFAVVNYGSYTVLGLQDGGVVFNITGFGTIPFEGITHRVGGVIYTGTQELNNAANSALSIDIASNSVRWNVSSVTPIVGLVPKTVNGAKLPIIPAAAESMYLLGLES